MGGKRVLFLAGLVRIVIPMCGLRGDWHTVDELELEIPRCSSGLLELFVTVALRRVISGSEVLLLTWS
jgi:hypothetical protein